MTGALERVRVLDFTTTIAGPHCTRLLADLGAEVIKIEAPEGDMMRTRPPLRNGASTSFGQLNAGKKSIVLDLKTPPAVEAVRRLSVTDELTGLYNGRHFRARLHEEIERAKRGGRPLALLVIDSDSLKSVNDRFGHEAGNRHLADDNSPLALFTFFAVTVGYDPAEPSACLRQPVGARY